MSTTTMNVWLGTCSICPAHIVIRSEQPAPTTCASCLAPLATLKRTDAELEERHA